MANFNFNPDKPDPNDIKRIYDECKAGIELYFDPEANKSYTATFINMTQEEIKARKRQEIDELSLRSSFYLLAYIESLFRTDFILRIQSHKKGYTDVLTRSYKQIYNPAQRLYSYSLTDVIFKNWQQYVIGKPHSKEMQDILRNLPQYFDFRNWVAHGRYWVFKETNYAKKYNYLQIQILLGNIEFYFGPFFMKSHIS